MNVFVMMSTAALAARSFVEDPSMLTASGRRFFFGGATRRSARRLRTISPRFGFRDGFAPDPRRVVRSRRVRQHGPLAAKPDVMSGSRTSRRLTAKSLTLVVVGSPTALYGMTRWFPGFGLRFG